MKLYYLNNQLVERPKTIIFDGITYTPPTDKILIQYGYEIHEVEEPQITNEIIQAKRANEYKIRADHYFLAYQAYMELGEIEKANEMKKTWLLVREEINKEFPYIEE